MPWLVGPGGEIVVQPQDLDAGASGLGAIVAGVEGAARACGGVDVSALEGAGAGATLQFFEALAGWLNRIGAADRAVEMALRASAASYQAVDVSALRAAVTRASELR